MTDSIQAAAKSRDREPPVEGYRPPSLWALITAHKRIAAAALAIVVVLFGLALVSDLGARVTRIADSTPCSVWSSSNQTKRDAYAALYVKQHGPLPSGASDSGTIEGVIDDGCAQAYGFDEADSITVLQAIRHQY